jgi:ABC-type transporter Mla subunit MlaD
MHTASLPQNTTDQRRDQIASWIHQLAQLLDGMPKQDRATVIDLADQIAERLGWHDDELTTQASR